MALKLIQGKQITVNLTGSFTGSFSGSFNGTSSYATNALTASYLIGGVSIDTGSLVTTASFNAYTGSSISQFAGTSSFATTAATASFITASNVYGPHGSNSVLSSSFAISSSRAVTASFATTAPYSGLQGTVPTWNQSTTGNAATATTASFALTSSNISPAITNNVNNFILTATGTGTINGESTLRFDGTTLIANSNFQQGGDVTATGGYSHAEGGGGTVASGINSHAEGESTQAIGRSSHAEGNSTVASGSWQHVQGAYNISSSAQSAFIIGNGTSNAARSNLVFASGSTFQVTGSLQVSGSITGSLFGTASFAVSSSRAVTASFATQALSSSYAVNATSASDISPAIANNSNNLLLTATGTGTINGESLLIFDGTTLELKSTILKHGIGTKAAGSYSHVEGESSEAIGATSHAEGQGAKTGNESAFRASVSSGLFIIESEYGDLTSIFTTGNTLISDDTAYDNLYGRQLYTISDVYWDGMFTVVVITDSSINTSFSNIGDFIFLGDWKSSNGNKTIPGISSHAEGFATTTFGNYSHAEGNGTIAVGDSSHTEGIDTIALGNYQHVQGQFNLPLITSSSFIHGNGTDNENRSNLIYAHDSTVEITGSLVVTDTITGNLTGTATNATSASYSLSSSFAISSSRAISSSFATTSSFTVSSSFAISSSVAVSASFASTASYVKNAQTSSYVLQAISSSFATTASYASNGGVTQLLAGPNISLSPTTGVGQVTISSTGGGGGFNTTTGSYGSFYSTQTQTNIAGTARSMSLNITDITNGVSVSGSTDPFNTYIKTENAGIYDIQFSAQVDKTDSGTDEIWIWLRKNGTDLTDTATSIQLVGNGAHYVAAWNFFVNSAANDYYQLMWYSPDANVRLHAEPAFGVVPGIPSLIVTANRVDQFLSNTGSFSGSFTGQFTGSLFGTSSYATQALSSSFATTASFALNAGGGGTSLGLVQAFSLGLQNIF
jgi:hypothetical protein